MVYYVAHAYQGNKENVEKATKITHNLQLTDLENTYICPLNMFSHLGYNEIGYEEEMQLCLDVLSLCDKLIVASYITEGVSREIEFAELVGMEVEYLSDA